MQTYDMKEYGINMNENSCNFGPTIIDNDLKNKNNSSFSMKYTPNKLQD